MLKADLASNDRGPTSAAHGRLSRDEYADLRARRDSAGREGHWGLYGLQVYRLAQRHPALPEPLPGRPRPVDLKSLPPGLARQLLRPKLKETFDKPAARGRYPEYALEVADLAAREGVALPSDFGPSRPADLAPALHAAYDDKLRPALGPGELAALEALEGRWPAYPRELVRLAKAHDLSLPGVTLPGAPSEWAKTYGGE